MDKFIVSYDDQNEILCLKVLRLLDREGLLEMLPLIQKLFEGKQRRYVLIDMTESAKFDPSFMNKEIRKAYKELMSQMDADKSAIFGASPAMRMISKIAIAITGRKVKTQFFETKEEALAWLEGEK